MQLRTILTTCGVLLLGGTASAQHHSLYQRDEQGAIRIQSASMVYTEALRSRELKLNDLVTIRVNEISNYINSGEIDRRNVSTVDARLQNWVALDGLNLIAGDKTGDELPRARGNYNLQSRQEGEISANELMTMNITARIVDIRPNGTLVLEARKTVQMNEEIIESALTGIIRREDITPNNIVTSDKVAELSIKRRTVGQVRDAYRRGWLTKFWDNVNPF